MAARSIKHILSGDLNAAVNSYPVFPGRERHLLRAQIARITHSCQVAPKDIYKEKEAEEGEEADMEKRGGLEVAKRPLPAALGLAVKYGPAAYKAGRALYK